MNPGCGGHASGPMQRKGVKRLGLHLTSARPAWSSGSRRRQSPPARCASSESSARAHDCGRAATLNHSPIACLLVLARCKQRDEAPHGVVEQAEQCMPAVEEWDKSTVAIEFVAADKCSKVACQPFEMRPLQL